MNATADPALVEITIPAAVKPDFTDIYDLATQTEAARILYDLAAEYGFGLDQRWTDTTHIDHTTGGRFTQPEFVVSVSGPAHELLDELEDSMGGGRTDYYIAPYDAQIQRARQQPPLTDDDEERAMSYLWDRYGEGPEPVISSLEAF